jgi:hypothetical protein
MANPNTIAGCVAWLEADISHCYLDSPPVNHVAANNDLVAFWEDRITPGVGVENGGHQGIFKTAGINGLPTVKGNAGDKGLNGDYLGGTTDFTAAVVFKPGAGVNNFERIIDHLHPTGFLICRNGTTANSWVGFILGTQITPPQAVSDTAAHVVILKRSGTTASIAVDGHTNKTTSTCPATANNTQPFSVLYNFNGGITNSSSDADVAMVALYNVAISDADEAVLCSYAGTKYNIPLDGAGSGTSACRYGLRNYVRARNSMRRRGPL